LDILPLEARSAICQ